MSQTAGDTENKVRMDVACQEREQGRGDGEVSGAGLHSWKDGVAIHRDRNTREAWSCFGRGGWIMSWLPGISQYRLSSSSWDMRLRLGEKPGE